MNDFVEFRTVALRRSDIHSYVCFAPAIGCRVCAPETVPLAEPSGRELTGFIRNPSQKNHYPTVVPNHPEHPDRIESVLCRLGKSDIAKYYVDLTPEVKNCIGTEEYIVSNALHSRNYVKTLQEQKEKTQEEINELASSYDSVQMTGESYEAAKEAACCALRLTGAVCSGRVRNGFALIRPPGHHALYNKAEGFCILNNVAIAARAAIELFRYTKVLIVDFDIHHGHGTQAEFYDSREITYLSIHRFEDGNYWPHLKSSDFNFLGQGKGIGHNINIPINENGGTHHDYLFILFTIILPVARELKPDIVFVSAGFDACLGDPIGYMDVEPEIFPHFIYQLASTCNGRVVCVLEGGYNHSAVSVCVDMCIRALIGEKPPRFKFSNYPRARTIDSCYNSIYINCKYWPALYTPYKYAPGSRKRHNVCSGPFNANPVGINTGNIIQHHLRNMERERPAKNIEIPLTWVHNSLFDLTHHEGISHFKRISNADQYEQLREIVRDFCASRRAFITSVYFIRQEKQDRKKSKKGLNLQLRGLLSCDYEERKHKIPKKCRENRHGRCATPTPVMPKDHREIKKAKRRGIVAKPVEDIFKGPHDDLTDLMQQTTLNFLKTETKGRIMAVNWGFEQTIVSNSSRLRVINVCQGVVASNTATTFSCNLSMKKKYTPDDLLLIIDRLLITFGYSFGPAGVILSLKLDGKKRGRHRVPWGNEEVLRPLIWGLQGVFNRRLLILVDGKRMDRIALYAGLSHYGREPSFLGLRRQKVSKSICIALNQAIMKCPPEGKSFLALNLRRLDAHLRVHQEDDGKDYVDDESDKSGNSDSDNC